MDIRSRAASLSFTFTDDQFLSWLRENSVNVTTPAYVYSGSRLDEAARLLKSLLPDGVRLFYSLKANAQPSIVRHLAMLGIGAEIASNGERRACAVADMSPQNTLIGGVSKSVEYLAAVCDTNPAGIVIESEREWSRLLEVLPGSKPPRVLLRVNPGIEIGGLEMADTGQFGLSVDQAVTIARNCKRHSNTEFSGLHFYFGSQRLHAETIVRTVTIVNEVVDRFRSEGLDPRVADIGLGCGVPYLARDRELDHDNLRGLLRPLWQCSALSGLELWSESGRALVAPSGYFVAQVLEKKRLHNKVFVFLDGGLNVHNPGLGLGRVVTRNPRLLFVRQRSSTREETFDLVGNLCTPADCLARGVRAPPLEEGDLVVIPNSGAYCQTTALWGFNGQPLFTEYLLTRGGALTELESQHLLQVRPTDRSRLKV
jgi:diaminopimelate decarboxylase